jgi:TolB protein
MLRRLFLLFILLPVSAFAALEIEITEGIDGAAPIAVVPFGWQGMAASAPLDIAAIVSADLSRSGRFKALPKRDMLAMPTDATKIRFRNWQALGQDNLLIGQIREAGAGQFVIQFQLFDVYKGEQLAGYSIPSTAKALRQTAHRISDLVYERLTGQKGAFSTRIAYVTVTRQKEGPSQYRLQVADADGFNPQTITRSEEPLMSPAWSPDGKQIAYVSFEGRRASIYVQTISTGKRKRVSSAPGINGAPAWSPDGSKLSMTLSVGGSPDIYLLDLITGSLRQLTKGYTIETESAWSPDGKMIAYTSDRGGKPQIYLIPVQGGKAKRLTYEGRYNARPVFSPDGKSIAMIHGQGGDYRIAVLGLESRVLQVLTKGRLDESPSFAPNGSMILYAAKKGERGVLSAVSADGKVHQKLVMRGGEVRDPAWSPN